MAEQRSSATSGGARTRQTEAERQPARSDEAQQAELYGSNPPAPDEDQNIRGSDMTDAADVAQNQMPGTPQVLEIDPQHRLEEERRRAFDEMVEEHDRKERGRKAPRPGTGPNRNGQR